MSWGEIKYALNSRLGTSDFVPLDKLITDGKSLVASEADYSVLRTSSSGDAFNVQHGSPVTETSLPIKVKTNCAGSARLKLYGEINQISSTPPACIINVYVNNVKKATGRIIAGDTQYTNFEPVSIDFSFNKNDTITLTYENTTIYNGYVTGAITKYALHATIVDGSLIDNLSD